MARHLVLGAVGRDVAVVQALLNLTPPSSLPPLATDGIFGLKTRARVVEFQRQNGLAPDGIVGPKTRAALSAGVIPDINTIEAALAISTPVIVTAVTTVVTISTFGAGAAGVAVVPF
jgi:peptidoglycan hydrolase-like protein with peptidoglycan-binding domain